MSTAALLQASGLWREIMDPKALRVVQAFYSRPWQGNPCSIDDVIFLAAANDVDPYPLMKMLEACNELTEEIE